ncbi:MAG: helix-turn-helix domain-containing protein [Ghiorsea sp.]
MSIKLMSAAWEVGLKTSSKMVLLALCDNASDDGRCFPSISNIAKRCSMSVRSVRNQIVNLTQKRYVEKQERVGRSNLYFITDPCNWCTPANSAPLQTTTITPANHDTTPAQFAGGAATGAPITITQPSHNHKGTTNSASASVDVLKLCPAGVEQIVWCEFVKMRKGIKAPLGEYAATLLANVLDKLGGDKNAILNQSIMNSWKGVFALKQANGKPQATGQSASEIAIENFNKRHGIGAQA